MTTTTNIPREEFIKDYILLTIHDTAMSAVNHRLMQSQDQIPPGVLFFKVANQGARQSYDVCGSLPPSLISALCEDHETKRMMMTAIKKVLMGSVDGMEADVCLHIQEARALTIDLKSEEDKLVSEQLSKGKVSILQSGRPFKDVVLVNLYTLAGDYVSMHDVHIDKDGRRYIEKTPLDLTARMRVSGAMTIDRGDNASEEKES